MNVVVDASALAALMFGEPAADAISERLNGRNLFAPRLLPIELASIARKKLNEVPDKANEIAVALAGYNALRIVERNCQPAAILAIVIETGLSAYDASYLLIARQLGVPLVTLDAELARAALALVRA